MTTTPSVGQDDPDPLQGLGQEEVDGKKDAAIPQLDIEDHRRLRAAAGKVGGSWKGWSERRLSTLSLERTARKSIFFVEPSGQLLLSPA